MTSQKAEFDIIVSPRVPEGKVMKDLEQLEK